MSRVPVLDYAFLAFETENSPKHVGGLQIFDLPAGAPVSFVADLVDRTRCGEPLPPFDQRLHVPIVGMPRWEHDDAFDAVDYVFHERLGEPGDMATLLERVSELHARRIDRSGPLWEIHFFEGLAPGRFAIYFKVHHAYMDGLSLSSVAMAALSESPEDDSEFAFWGRPTPEREATRRGVAATLFGTARRLGRLALGAPALARLGLMHGLRVAGLSGHELPVPFTAPRTAFNGPVTRRRSVGVASLSLARLGRIAKHAGVTINDVLLELCDSAMTGYLAERDAPPVRPLVAQMPISLQRGGIDQGNQITIALLELGADSDDPVQRLQHIHAHTSNVKREFRSMPAEAAEAYTVLLQGAAQLGELTGLDRLLPPLGNVIVSNLAGPSRPRFLAGAPLRAVYPVSTIAPGLAINITGYSYDGALHIGIVAAASEISDVDALARAVADAAPALERAMGLGPSRDDAGAGRKTAKTIPPAASKKAARKRATHKKATRKKTTGKRTAGKKTARKKSAGKKTVRRAAGEDTVPSSQQSTQHGSATPANGDEQANGE